MKKRSVGLALGSGGMRGFAHIGVLKVLKNNDIPIDYIAGSSAGAIAGGAYAANQDLDSIEQFFEKMPYWELAKSFSDVDLRSGIVKGEKFITLLEGLVGKKLVEECQIPFAAVATEKQTGKGVDIAKGLLSQALRASSSIPVIFSPYKHPMYGELLDGGVTQQVPVDTVKRMGADIVIAVNLSENTTTYNEKSNISTMQHYVLLLLKKIAEENVRNADVLIAPEFKDTDWLTNFKDRAKIINEGAEAAERALPGIRALLSLN